MARRVVVYREEFMFMNHISTFGYALTAVAALILFISIVASLFRKRDCGNDPWNVNEIQQSFEWATTSPPPPYNFEEVPPIPITDPRKPADKQ
jgi:cytochrome c oxidase subunit 1